MSSPSCTHSQIQCLSSSCKTHRFFGPFLGAEITPRPIYVVLGEQFGYLWIQVIMGLLLLVLILFEKKDLTEKLLLG